MSLRQYAPGLYGWGRLNDKWGFDFNGTAIVQDGTTVLIVDPVEPTADELEALRGLGHRFSIVLLNADHERHSASLAGALGADIYVHTADQSLLKNADVLAFEDGHDFGWGWHAMQLHDLKTPGETVLYSESQRTLMVGDAIIGDPVTGLRLVPAMKIPDQDKATQSLSRLLDLSFDRMILSDGFVVPSGAHGVVERFIQARM